MVTALLSLVKCYICFGNLLTALVKQDRISKRLQRDYNKPDFVVTAIIAQKQQRLMDKSRMTHDLFTISNNI